MNNSVSAIEQLAQKYNQLYLTPEEGISFTGVYSDVVKCGKIPESISYKITQSGLTGFSCSEKDKLMIEETPAGPAEILYIYNSSDFDRFIQIMAYQCEPVTVSSVMNSAEISGITNWRKIESHMKEYLVDGGDPDEWKEELRRFTLNRSNYQDSIIVIRRCRYSGLTAGEAGFTEEEWERYSRKLMIYHSISHFVTRKLYPESRNIFFNEITADCLAMLFTFDKYSASLAKKFLGVSKRGYNDRGRLANYYFESRDQLNTLAVKISGIIDRVSSFVSKMLESEAGSYYDILMALQEKSKSGIFEERKALSIFR
ncbi:MAG: hypothetical protein Q4F95_01285 [Oscillospiraceae bacterium]|nr:hypothetical protein [Oscillospiraceae bacterium]